MTELQAEWKAVGQGPRKQERELWHRFRTACNTFFARRKANLAERKQVWSINLRIKEELCERIEALAEPQDLSMRSRRSSRRRPIGRPWVPFAGPVRRPCGNDSARHVTRCSTMPRRSSGRLRLSALAFVKRSARRSSRCCLRRPPRSRSRTSRRRFATCRVAGAQLQRCRHPLGAHSRRGRAGRGSARREVSRRIPPVPTSTQCVA